MKKKQLRCNVLSPSGLQFDFFSSARLNKLHIHDSDISLRSLVQASLAAADSSCWGGGGHEGIELSCCRSYFSIC